MRRIVVVAAIVAGVGGPTGPARAQSGPTLVIAPAGSEQLEANDLARATASLKLVASNDASLAWGEPDVKTDTGLSPADCSVDAKCLAELGAKIRAARVVGVYLGRSGKRFELTFLLVDVARAEPVWTQTYELKRDGLDRAPAEQLTRFLAEIEPSAPPAAPPAEPPPSDSPPPTAPAAPPVAIAPAHRTPPTALVRVGSYLPRGRVNPGITVGTEFVVAGWPWSRMSVSAGFDWTSLAGQEGAFVGPPDYPRSHAMLIQSSQLFTARAAVELTIVRFGATRIAAGLGGGVAVNRSEFEAYGRTRAENDVAPVGFALLGARGTLGRLAWTVDVAWREQSFDLGSSGSFGEDTLSGVVASGGVGVAF